MNGARAGAGGPVFGLRGHGPFMRFWWASSVSDFGSYLTTLALSVLVLVTLQGSALDQGLLNATRWAPYLLFGLLAGIWVDRFGKQRMLVATDLGRGTVLALICGAALSGLLTMPLLLTLIFAFGVLALLGDAAAQSYLPGLVPRPLLVRANARLQQSDTVAQTTGGALAGTLIAVIGAPFALLADAASYFFSAAMISSIPGSSEPTAARAPVRMRRQIAEGLSWVYRHRFLGPLAVGTHLWFIGSAMLGAVLPVLVLVELGWGPVGLGLVVGASGVGAVIGTGLSLRAGSRWGIGRVVTAARLVEPIAVALVAAAPLVFEATRTAASGTGPAPEVLWPALLIGVGQFVFGLAMGIEGPLEMGYQQAVTPDALLARMSATRRSANRGMIVVGAPLGGLLATGISVGFALWSASFIMMVAGLVLLVSPFRAADIPAGPPSDS